jgi:2-polyprenyl-6-methoxyphenol hydroxylase-like FAD-dependent oxidoreductase
LAEIVIIGAGVAGLGAALGLEARGHSVTIVEQDAPPTTTHGDVAFDVWDRRSVPQFRQAHGFSARARTLLVKYAPGVLDRLRDDGIDEANFFKLLAPPEIHRPEDDAFTGLMTRRPAFELALRLEAEERPHIRFECPATASDLVLGTEMSPPVVRGVRLRDRRELFGDVVLDCGGRRSRVVQWLSERGVSISETVEDCGLTYFTRYFRRTSTSQLPIVAIFGINTAIHNMLVIGFPGDHDTFAITFSAAAWDDDLRQLRHEWAWDAVAATLPPVAPWVASENATPITDVATMTGHRNIRRQFMPNGEPAVLGLLPVGDSLCTTNPAYGWGASMALTYAFAACDALAAGTDDLRVLAKRYDAAVAAEADGVYLEASGSDRIRGYRWRDEAIPEADQDEAERQSLIEEGLLPSVLRDEVIARALLRRANLVESPRALLDDPEVVSRARVRRDKNRARAAETPGLSRQDILDVIAAAHP